MGKQKGKKGKGKGETVRASHILLKDEKTAEEVLRLLKEGNDFAALAMKYSTCPSKSVGGSLGKFGRGDMVKPFEDAVFSMNKGEVRGPVKTEFGYHVIKRTG
ncbi:MAG: peptidylprolyl isomerase [Promethearchaeota archaeon]